LFVATAGQSGAEKQRACKARFDPRLDTDSVVLQVDVEIGQAQLLANALPDDARHFIAVHLDGRLLDFDLIAKKVIRLPLQRSAMGVRRRAFTTWGEAPSNWFGERFVARRALSTGHGRGRY
jgi:hypothetical protein